MSSFLRHLRKVWYPAAILLQLDYNIKSVCVEFLLKQLNTSNCLGINKFADFYNCLELSPSSKEYIKTYFLKVVETEEFLSLSLEEAIYLIFRDDINVPFEEKVCILKFIIVVNCIFNIEVDTFNGLLYIIGGFDRSTHLDSVEIYDPNNITWTMESFPTSVTGIYGALIINLPSNLRND